MRGFLLSFYYFSKKCREIALLILLHVSLSPNLSLSNFSNFQGKFMGNHAYTETEMNLIEHEVQNRDTLDECPA
ncbi:hypothetical protein Saga11_18810 [Bacillus safensis]|nr:hypothetical protein Saga11_18810 [Bacillus safensis]